MAKEGIKELDSKCKLSTIFSSPNPHSIWKLMSQTDKSYLVSLRFANSFFNPFKSSIHVTMCFLSLSPFLFPLHSFILLSYSLFVIDLFLSLHFWSLHPPLLYIYLLPPLHFSLFTRLVFLLLTLLYPLSLWLQFSLSFFYFLNYKPFF